jgi:type II secretory pathway component PulC
MLRPLLLSSLLSTVALAGCATQMPAQPKAQKGAESGGDPVTNAHTDPDTDNPPSKGKKQPSSELSPSDGARGAIARTELAKVLDASPGYFLQHVQTEPRFAHGRFAGWRVVSFFPGDARFAGVDLQAGDVVTRINGKPIEKPDQFMVVWSELRSSKELVVDVERAGAPRRLRWTIADK